MKSRFILIAAAFALLAFSTTPKVDPPKERNKIESAGVGQIPPMPVDETGRRPVTLPFWECGPGVYTNGQVTYYSQIVPPGTPGAYMILDHFSESVYWVTTHWGVNSMCSNRP